MFLTPGGCFFLFFFFFEKGRLLFFGGCLGRLGCLGCLGCFSMWVAASDARIDHLFALRVEGEQLPMCELARVVRRTPADAAWCCLVGGKGA